MTYGHSTGALMAELTGLLKSYRRVSSHLGKPAGGLSETSTLAQRTEMVALIMAYRHTILRWARDGARLGPAGSSARPYAQWPPTRLARTLDAHVTAAVARGARSASTLELGTPHEYVVVEAWRRAAVAATEGREQDLPVLAANLARPAAHSAGVVRDVAAVTEALPLLDRRWSNTPGWQVMPDLVDGTHSLARSARAASVWYARGAPVPDPTLDEGGYLGQCPPKGTRAILASVQHSLSGQLPTARALRTGLKDLAAVARWARIDLLHHGEDELAAHAAQFASRALALGRELANVAAPRGSIVFARACTDLVDSVTSEEADPAGLYELTTSLVQIGRRVADTLSAGIAGGCYVATWSTRLDQERTGGVRRAHPHYEPLTRENHCSLDSAVQALRHTSLPVPPAAMAIPSAAADAIREELRATTHQARPLRRRGLFQPGPSAGGPHGAFQAEVASP